MRNALTSLVPVNGKRIRIRRHLSGWTQQQLADASGVSRSYIGELERGEGLPSYLVADSLAEALGVEVDDLVSTQPLQTKGSSGR